jgi:hypothetical protein
MDDLFTQKTTVPVDPKRRLVSEFNYATKRTAKEESANLQ